MLTEGGYPGWLRYLRKARALDTRLRRSESQLPQEFICQAALSGNGLGGAGDNGPDAQEPDNRIVGWRISFFYAAKPNFLLWDFLA
jgi:hypothetical protein